MDFIAILVIALLVAVTAWWVLHPLWSRIPPVPLEPANSPYRQTLAELEQHRNSVYTAIKDLELDFETGKIDPEDYQQVRAHLTRQAADLLRRIDRLAQTLSAGLDETVDALLAAYQPDSDPALMEGVRAEIAREAQQTRFCSACGYAVDPGDRFCVKCGARLLTEAAE